MKQAFYKLPKIFSQFPNCLITQIDANIYKDNIDALGDSILVICNKYISQRIFLDHMKIDENKIGNYRSISDKKKIGNY